MNGKQSILIVDDMASNIEILNGILGNDYNILFALNGHEALDIAYEQVPDLILLDVVMPDMDGYIVCSYLKAEEKTRDIPVIFVTSMDQEDDESRGLDAGGSTMLQSRYDRPLSEPECVITWNSNVPRPSKDNLDIRCSHLNLQPTSFDEVLEKEWLRSKRSQTPLSLLLMDIDFFKAYNDKYGHPAGDDCLRRLASGLADVVLRPADLFARYGGENSPCYYRIPMLMEHLL